MSITFQVESDGGVEPLNFSNGNAAALMVLAGLTPAADGEVRGRHLSACVHRLIQAVNSDRARADRSIETAESPRWFEGGRTDEYLQRRASDMLRLFASAQQRGCGIYWS